MSIVKGSSRKAFDLIANVGSQFYPGCLFLLQVYFEKSILHLGKFILGSGIFRSFPRPQDIAHRRLNPTEMNPSTFELSIFLNMTRSRSLRQYSPPSRDSHISAFLIDVAKCISAHQFPIGLTPGRMIGTLQRRSSSISSLSGLASSMRYAGDST